MENKKTNTPEYKVAPHFLKDETIKSFAEKQNTNCLAPSLPDLSSKRHSPNPIGYSYEGSSKSASTDKLVSNGHVLSDEDSEDEHDHESVVTSLLNKYNPRRPFDANAKPEPIVYTGKADRKTKEKVDKLKAHSPTKRILQELPPMTERKQRPVSIPKLGMIFSTWKTDLTASIIGLNCYSCPYNCRDNYLIIPQMTRYGIYVSDLSDAENSDTNLSQFNVNGKETPLYGELDSRRYSQSNAVVPVEHLAASPIPNTNAALEPRFIPEISDADFIDPPQLNLQTVANQPPEERFTNKPPSRFQDTPTASGRISQVPKYHLSKQRNQRPSRSEPRGNSAVEKDKSNLLSAELTKLLEEKRYRKKFENRSKSATEKLQPGSIVTPPKSPYDQYNKKFKSSISQPSSSNENLLHADARQSKTYSFDDQFPNLENKLKPHNSASLVNLDSNSPPLGFKSSPTPYSRIVPATEKPAFVQPSPTNTPQTASPVRPKSRRNWAAENDGGNDFEFADDLLDRVKQISREFDVDPTNPIHEDFGKLPIYTDKNGEKYYQGPGNCSQRPSFIDEDDDSRDYLSFLDDSKVNIDDFSLIDEDRSRKSAYQTPGDIFANGFHSKTEEPGNNSTSPFPPEPMQNYSYMQTNQINDPDFSLQNFAQYSRENSSPGGKSVNSIASTSNTYDILSSPEKINLERSAPQFFNPSTSANELQPMSEENSSDEDLSAFKDSFTPPERQTVTLPDEEILPEKDEPSFSQNSQLERNKPSVFNPQPLSRRHIAPKPQDRANHKEPFARERVPNVTGAQPQDRKISPIHELEEHESPDFKDKMSQRFGSLRVSPPVSHNNPRIEELLNDQLYADSLPQVSRQRPNEFNHVPRSSNSKPLNTSTLESESKNSFTIGLDETEREGEISYASTPTILKDSMVTDCRFSDDPRKRKTKIPVPKISKEPNGKTENKPPEKKPVSVVEYNFKTPAAVNLISYDDWKLKFSEDVDPTDKIQKPIKARKTPRVTSSKNRQPSLREKKRRSHASQKSEASRNTTKMPNSNQSTTTNSTQRAKEAPRKHYDHPIKQVRVIPQSQPINSRPEKHMNRKSYDHRPDPNRSKSADTVSMSDPNIPHKEHEPPSYKIGFPVSRNEDDPRSERKRNSSHDEKMGFNVALGSFNKGSSRKNSPSPRSSPKVTPRNSLERGKSPVLRYIPPNSKAPLKKPSPQQPSLVPRLPETKQKIVQPLNFMKLNENDFRAKRNYFEISAKLKDGTNTVKAKDQKQKNASNKTIDPTWI